MKQRHLRIWAVVLAVALLTGVAGACAPAATTPAPTPAPTTAAPKTTAAPNTTVAPATSAAPTTSAPTTAAPTITVPATTTAAKPAEKVKLRWTSWMTKGEDKPMLEDFMTSHPNIIVEDQAYDAAQYETLMKTMMMSGDGPDVFLYFNKAIREFVSQGYLADVSNEPSVKVLDTVAGKYPDLKNIIGVDGKYYGFPVNGSSGSVLWVWYNKKLWAEKGYTVPKTRAEYVQLMDKMKADGLEPLIFGMKDAWTAGFLLYNYKNLNAGKYTKFGGLEMDQKLGSGELKYSDVFGDAWRNLADWVKKGYISKAGLTMKWEQSAQYWVDGHIGMLMQGSWMPTSDAVKAADPAKFELGLFAEPYDTAADGKIHLTGGVDRTLMLNAKSKQMAAAKTLFNYVASPDVNKKYLDRQSLRSLLYPEKPDPLWDAYNAVKNGSNVQVGFLQETRLNGAGFDTAPFMTALMTGADVEDQLKKADADFEKVRSKIKIDDIK